MLKSYLRYEESSRFGVVAASRANLCTAKRGKVLYTSGVQDVLVWNAASGQLNQTLRGDTEGSSEVTCLCVSQDEKFVAAGYSHGRIRVWNTSTKELHVMFNGHDKAVTSLAFSNDGSKLASGSADTSIIIWDAIALGGLFKLRGHSDQVTCVRFIDTPDSVLGSASIGSQLMSASKDGLMKLWDLNTQSCVHTVVGHRSAVWAFDVHPSGDRLWTGSQDNMLRCVERLTEDERKQEVDEQDGKQTVVAGTLVRASDGEGAAAGRVDVVAPKLAGEPWRVLGHVQRQTNERVASVSFSADGEFLGCQAAGKVFELFRSRTSEQIQKRIKRRVKRVREKQQQHSTAMTATDNATAIAAAAMQVASKLEAADLLEPICVIRTTERINSFGFGSVGHNSDGFGIELLLGLNNNCVEVYNVKATTSSANMIADKTQDGSGDVTASKKRKRVRQVVDMSRTRAIELGGHRSDVRSLAMSSDGSLLLTASNGSVKLWNTTTSQSVRTMKGGYALCCAFVPGDLHALVGTKTGNLVVYNLASGLAVHDVAAHEGPLWSLAVRPDGRGFMTGGADKQVRFWEFELVDQEVVLDDLMDEDGGESDTSSVEDEKERERMVRMQHAAAPKQAQLQVVLARSMKMAEDVLCLRYSHHRAADKLLVAVSLLDCTVKVFFDDSLKFFLSLYGHKLPVLAMDISTDNTLLVTGSADKNIKVWGLDFGDCHKSMFAHDNSVTGVCFVPNTHYVFTSGKDQRLRYWDVDRFELIQSMENHVGEVWALGVDSTGARVITSGHDKTIRVWQRTDEPLIPEDERETELEKLFESKLTDTKTDPSKTGTAAVPAIQAEAQDGTQVESEAVGKRSIETMKGGERLMEALDIVDAEVEAMKRHAEEHAAALSHLSKIQQRLRAKKEALGEPLPPLIAMPKPSVYMLGKTPLAFLCHELIRVRAHDREEALLVLPFSYATKLLVKLNDMLCLGWQVETVAQVALYLTRIHLKQIVATHSLRPLLEELSRAVRPQLRKLRDTVGVNVAGLKLMKDQVHAKTTRTFVQ